MNYYQCDHYGRTILNMKHEIDEDEYNRLSPAVRFRYSFSHSSGLNNYSSSSAHDSTPSTSLDFGGSQSYDWGSSSNNDSSSGFDSFGGGDGGGGGASGDW